MPELASITIKGYKSIASIENLKLGAINVLIGANGSGKSNFIGVFTFLRAIREGRLLEYVLKTGGAERVLHFGSKTTKKLSLQVTFAANHLRYDIDLSPVYADVLMPENELIRFLPFGRRSMSPAEFQRQGNEAGIGSSKESLFQNVRRSMATWVTYQFHDTSPSSPMKKTADLHDNKCLRFDGANLAPYLYYLQQKESSSYNMIRNTVQKVAPFFDGFVLEPQKLNPDKIRLEWRHKGSEAYFDASSLSDGTLRFIALATLFLQPENLRPSVILVDEPELGLHPYAITLFASLVKQAAVRTQVILSTQSSSLVDHFEPEDVLVADRVDGGTQLTRLDSDRLEPWLENYSLGQLWEKNEIGGRPAAESAHV